MFGPDLIKESERKVKLIRDRLKVASPGRKAMQMQNARRQFTKSEIESIFVYHHSEELSVLELRES